MGRAMRPGAGWAGGAGGSVTCAALRGPAPQPSSRAAASARSAGEEVVERGGTPPGSSLPRPESQPCCRLRAGSVCALLALKITLRLRVPAWLSRRAGLEPRAIFTLPLHRARGLEKENGAAASPPSGRSARDCSPRKPPSLPWWFPPFSPRGCEASWRITVGLDESPGKAAEGPRVGHGARLEWVGETLTAPSPGSPRGAQRGPAPGPLPGQGVAENRGGLRALPAATSGFAPAPPAVADARRHADARPPPRLARPNA